VRLEDESVSRAHATLRVDDHSVVLEEHAARNGVRVNGSLRRGAIDLAPGDRIALGTVELVLVESLPFGEEGEAAATRPLPKLGTSERPRLAQLSGRERDVLERIARGQTQRQIADELGVSVKTVETYRARLGEKLGLKGRAELVAFALQAGVLSRRSSLPPRRPSFRAPPE
jgi:DNA-binding CsgD family transcriptional regulator